LSVDVAVTRDAFSLEVRFEAPPGVTILFGPSGSGKSTILGAIAGLVTPARGKVTLGADVWFDAASGVDVPVHRRGVAFVFQSLALFPHMTAAENVVYGMERSLAAPERRSRAIAMLERLRVGHLADRRPATFSGGEAQRVALARAFAMKPRIVLLDEPFSAMDRDLREQLCADVRGFVDEVGVPMVHVTHHRGEARALGDRAVVIDKGRIVKTASVSEALDEDDDDAPSARRKRGRA
jgi:molybdate transport system ATP-binding protein